METGRPTDFTQTLSDQICAQIADGQSLRTICRAEGMPDKSTVFRWLRIHTSFRDQYTRAREAAADAFVEEMLDIADEGSNDWMELNDGENVSYRVNGEAINRSRLRVDTRKWIASRLQPKKYGERQQVEHSGSLTLTQLISQATGVPCAEDRDSAAQPAG